MVYKIHYDIWASMDIKYCAIVIMSHVNCVLAADQLPDVQNTPVSLWNIFADCLNHYENLHHLRYP